MKAKKILDDLKADGSGVKERATFTIDSELLASAKRHLNGRPLSRLMNNLLKEFLEEIEKEGKAA